MAIKGEEDDHHHHQPNEIKTSQTVLPLLTEIILEILSRLPVESLLRCRSVCKQWCSLISNPHFIKSHHHLSTRNNHKLIFSTTRRNRRMNLKSCNLHDVMHANFVNAVDLDYPSKHGCESVQIIGCCNGLVCLTIDVVGVFLWNPSTRKSNKLPSNGHTGQRYWSQHYGYGYEESSDDYKVVEMCVKFEGSKYETSVLMYSLRSGSWKSIGTFPHGMPLDYYGRFFNGAVHWGADNDQVRDYSTVRVNEVVQVPFNWHIIFLDLAKESYGEIVQPVYDEGKDYNDLTLGSLKGWLCVLSNYRGINAGADLWVMKEYGVGDSWTKLVTIPYLTDPGLVRFYVPLCISNDGKFLLELGWKVVVYDPKNRSFSEIQKMGKCDQVSTFVESLVSPMPAVGVGDRL